MHLGKFLSNLLKALSFGNTSMLFLNFHKRNPVCGGRVIPISKSWSYVFLNVPLSPQQLFSSTISLQPSTPFRMLWSAYRSLPAMLLSLTPAWKPSGSSVSVPNMSLRGLGYVSPFLFHVGSEGKELWSQNPHSWWRAFHCGGYTFSVFYMYEIILFNWTFICHPTNYFVEDNNTLA